MRKDRFLVTAKGLEQAKAELAEKLVKKEELKVVLESTRDAGDLRENDGFTLAMEDFKNNEAEIMRLEELISKAKIVKSKTKGKVELGDTVVLQDKKGLKKKITLVGANESNPLEGKVSYNSPLGGAILNLSEGDTFEFVTPKEKVEYKIAEVID
ncbi:GreA/GreB family elongation factor [bacterium]|nr:GreA/GreB family elongation factor [bacterium]